MQSFERHSQPVDEAKTDRRLSPDCEPTNVPHPQGKDREAPRAFLPNSTEGRKILDMANLREHSQSTSRRKVDWEAVERDYRATQMTLRELGAKHGCDHAAIARKASKCEWKKDLASAVRKATSAKLIEQAVNSVVNDRQQAVTNIVLVAAELNKQVILGHRRRLGDLSDAVEQAKAKLMSLGSSVTDIRDAAVFVQGVCHLASATRTLIEQERRAFNLDDQQPAETEKEPDRIASLALVRARFDEILGRTDGQSAHAPGR